METASFTYTKARKDLSEQIVGSELTGDAVELLLRQAQFLGEQLRPAEMLTSPHYMMRRLPQRNEVSLARHERVFRSLLPTGDSKQLRA